MGEKKESQFARVAEREEEKSIAKTGSWSVATATEEGMPNVVPMAFAKVLSKNPLMLVDVFLKKTRMNLLTNPNIAISVWD